jgi:hypothetical protein
MMQRGLDQPSISLALDNGPCRQVSTRAVLEPDGFEGKQEAAENVEGGRAAAGEPNIPIDQTMRLECTSTPSRP